MKNFKFENWSKENCLELISSVKEVINWEDPLEVANDLLKLAIDFKSKGSPQADTYKKAHELAMENIYEGGGDPFKTMGQKILEVDRRLEAGLISPIKHKYIIEQIITFFEQ